VEEPPEEDGMDIKRKEGLYLHHDQQDKHSALSLQHYHSGM